MTTTLLVESIAAEIRACTAKLKLPIEYHNEQQRRMESTWRKVNVYEQYIPKDLYQNETYYPCVVVEWLETRDKFRGEEIESVADIGLSCGVFAKEADGWKDAFHLMELIRQRLLSVRTIAQRFRLSDESMWQSERNQPEPFFFVYSLFQYNIYQQQEPIPLERTLSPDLLTIETPKILKVDAFNRRTN